MRAVDLAGQVSELSEAFSLDGECAAVRDPQLMADEQAEEDGRSQPMQPMAGDDAPSMGSAGNEPAPKAEACNIGVGASSDRTVWPLTLVVVAFIGWRRARARQNAFRGSL